jgi:photosystem II stability/assembly factor-like uncharacterized protein
MTRVNWCRGWCRMHLALAIALVLVVLAVASQANVEAQTTGALWALTFTQDGTGLAAGDNGLMLRTADAGSTWEHIQSGSSERIEAVSLARDGGGWAVTARGGILRSTDGGASWSFQARSHLEPEYGDVTPLYGVFTIDAEHAWAVGGYRSVIATKDGGGTWTRIDTGLPFQLRDISFVNPQIGWVVGDYGAAAKTFDGGASWQRMDVGVRQHLWKIAWLGPDRGVVSLIGAPLRETVDGGNSWYEGPDGLYALAEDGGILFAAGKDGRIVRHDNDRWTEAYPSPGRPWQASEPPQTVAAKRMLGPATAAALIVLVAGVGVAFVASRAPLKPFGRRVR